MSNKQTSILVVSLIFLGLISSTLFTVYESQRAIILRLGKLQPNVLEPGLHWKVPFIDEIKNFDVRLNLLDIKSSRITTSEKKDVLVDFFVQWRIKDLNLFLTRTDGMALKAESLLQEKAVSGLKIEFGRLTIKEVVSEDRAELMERLRKTVNDNSLNMGIIIEDVRIKRIDLPDTVSNSVYNRMRAERLRAANEFRANGERAAIERRAQADKEKKIILATAEKQARTIKGEGDAKAIAIYANAYNKSPEFFEFYKSINAYKSSFKNKNDILVLKPDGEFFKYFMGKDKK